MKRRFFLNNFMKYSCVMMVPMIVIFLSFMYVTQRESISEVERQANYTLEGVNTYFDMVISNIVFQNDQLILNPHSMLALKEALKENPRLSYNEYTHIRKIQNLMNSITNTYDYVDSVALGLKNHSRYISSTNGLQEITEEEATWMEVYENMPEDRDTFVFSRTVGLGDQKKDILTILQRMMFLDGVIVMNIDINQYCKILESIIQSDSEGIVFFDSEGEYIFEWNPNGYEDLNTIDTKKIFSSKSNMHTINISGKRYIVNELCNTTYQLNMVSVMPVANIYIESMDLVVIFTAFGCVAAVVLLYLAYVSSKHYFEKIEYLIETFQKAEQGDYPTVPIQEIKNEYDVVFNNIIYLFLHNVKLKQEILVKEKEQKAIELSALQFQINPHFLFNILQTVQFEIGKLGKDAVVARSTIDSLSDILRYSLGTSRESIELKEEILYLKKYIEIQRVRFGNSFIVYYEIDDGLEQAQVFRLMLQPLVENSIMHGIRQIDMNGYIKIRILKRESNIICRVMDNGVGMDQEEKRKLQEQIQRVGSRHIGLANVNCRLKLFYGDKAQIKIHSKKGMGSVMEFSIPYIEEKITV